MKKALIVISIALLFLLLCIKVYADPWWERCEELCESACPDCICEISTECPDCICSDQDVCPSVCRKCPDCICPECPGVTCPEIPDFPDCEVCEECSTDPPGKELLGLKGFWFMKGANGMNIGFMKVKWFGNYGIAVQCLHYTGIGQLCNTFVISRH